MGEFILFFVTIFSFFFLQIDYFTKMRNIFLFFYLPCVILRAKTFQRKTDIMETDGVASPARRNQLDRQQSSQVNNFFSDLRERDVGSPEVPQSRTWETWVADYKNMMDPSKCTSRARDRWTAFPCVDGRRVGCSYRYPTINEYGYGMCWRDSRSGYGWKWLSIYDREFRCEFNFECKYIEWYYNEHGAFAGGYDFNGEGRRIYNEIRRRIAAQGGQL